MLERITKKVFLSGVPYFIETDGNDILAEDMTPHQIGLTLKRLAAYEDTGLSPEDIPTAKALLIDEWEEDFGDCLWWAFPVKEPPYCGTPLDRDFPNHVTHFTKLIIPKEPS